MRAHRSLSAAAFVLALSACAAPGKFVWVDAYQPPPEAPKEGGYHLAPGDVVSVRALNHESVSASRLKVRSDGRITVPFVNDVDVADRTPTEVARILEQGLKSYIQNAVVSVTVDEPRPFVVAVMGEVSKPGNYAVEPGSGVLEAIASAGGVTQYAHDDGVYVLRRHTPEAAPERIRFRYRSLSRAEGAAAAFKLQPRDLVVVE